MLYVHCTLMDESRQCLTCLLLLTPIMFPDGNHFTFQSLLFSVFAKLLFAHSTRISSAVIIVVLLLGVTDFYPKFTFVLSSGGDRLDVRQEQENLRFLLHHCCLTVPPCKLCSPRLSPVSCGLLNSPPAASPSCPVLAPGPRPAAAGSIYFARSRLWRSVWSRLWRGVWSVSCKMWSTCHFSNQLELLVCGPHRVYAPTIWTLQIFPIRCMQIRKVRKLRKCRYWTSCLRWLASGSASALTRSALTRRNLIDLLRHEKLRN